MKRVFEDFHVRGPLSRSGEPPPENVKHCDIICRDHDTHTLVPKAHLLYRPYRILKLAVKNVGADCHREVEVSGQAEGAHDPHLIFNRQGLLGWDPDPGHEVLARIACDKHEMLRIQHRSCHADFDKNPLSFVRHQKKIL